MKRILVILLVFMAASALLFASGKQEKATGEGSFEGMELVIMSAGDGSKEFRIISPWLPEFEKRYGVKVNWNEMSIGNLHTRLATLFAAQSPEADIVWTGHKFTAEFAAAGGLLDVTDRLPQDLIGDLTAAKGVRTRVRSAARGERDAVAWTDAGVQPLRAPGACDRGELLLQRRARVGSQLALCPDEVPDQRQIDGPVGVLPDGGQRVAMSFPGGRVLGAVGHVRHVPQARLEIAGGPRRVLGVPGVARPAPVVQPEVAGHPHVAGTVVRTLAERVGQVWEVAARRLEVGLGV